MASVVYVASQVYLAPFFFFLCLTHLAVWFVKMA
jgi:hypothetical protein